MDEYLETLGVGLILCWALAAWLLVIIGLTGPTWDEPFYLPSWTLAALLLPLPLCYLAGYLVGTGG